MTPKERTAMQQALEALESCNVGNWSMAFDEFAVVEAITALREALAEQTEQEPVAWRWSESNGERWFDWRTDWTKHDEALRLGFKVEYAYAAPVRTKDLTDDEIHKAFYSKNTGLINGIRAVIAADREKNK